MRIRLDGKRAPHTRQRPLYRPSTRRWKLETLLPAVRELVVQSSVSHGITVAEVATALRAKPGLVHQCFHKLNLEGLLSQGSNGLMHEIRRGQGRNNYSGWVDTIYVRLR